MILGEEVLLGTLITMVPTVFEKNDFKGYLSHSQISKYFMLFLDSETSPWTQFLWKGLIFDTQHDALKVLRKFENFGKSRNNIWVPPMISNNLEWPFRLSKRSLRILKFYFCQNFAKKISKENWKFMKFKTILESEQTWKDFNF